MAIRELIDVKRRRKAWEKIRLHFIKAFAWLNGISFLVLATALDSIPLTSPLFYLVWMNAGIPIYMASVKVWADRK